MEVSGPHHAPAALLPVPTVWEARWASLPVRTFRRTEKSLASAGNIELRFLGRPSRSLVTIPTKLSQFQQGKVNKLKYS
jgi:hypothetical protein